MTNSESELRSSARPRLAPVEAGGTTPLRFGDDPYVWASWLYYQEGMTQNDIAQTMGISRATVITYLNEARERGIVNIAIEPARLASLTIAQSLKSHFNLRDCLVVPNGVDDRALGDRLGAAGAMAVRKFLKSGDTLAVTGGRTVMAVGDSLKIAGLQDVTVVQAIGGAIARNPASPSQCASTIASAVNATCVNLSAPAVASSVDGAGDHGRRAARRRADEHPVARQQGAVRHRIAAAERLPLQRGRLRGRRTAKLHRRRRGRRAGGAFHRRLGTAGRRGSRRPRDRPVARRPAARRPAHLRGGRIRQGAGDSRRAPPRLRQCARHRRRDGARRAAGRRRRRA